MKKYIYTGPISDELRPDTEVTLDEEAPRTRVLLSLKLLQDVPSVVTNGDATAAPELEAAVEVAPAQAEPDAPPRSKKPASKKSTDEAPKTQRAPRSSSRPRKGG